jgi:glycosyltransferase involved in cell wall biosynthesis
MAARSAAFIRRWDRYIVVSKDLERYLTQRVGIAAGRISQIYNGVDTERFAPHSTGAGNGLPAEFAEQDTFVIGTVGRIQPVKDQFTLLKAFAELVQSNARLRLAVIGDGPLLGDLRRFAETLGIAKLTWLPGAIGNIRMHCVALTYLFSLRCRRGFRIRF